jgi:hypothetical protein
VQECERERVCVCVVCVSKVQRRHEVRRVNGRENPSGWDRSRRMGLGPAFVFNRGKDWRTRLLVAGEKTGFFLDQVEM